MRFTILRGFFAVAGMLVVVIVSLYGQSDFYLNWSKKQAEEIGKAMRAKGRIPGTRRLLNTEQSVGYKLRATWLTQDVIRASARLIQLKERLSDEETRALVSEAERVSGIVVLIDLDPDEGSGVIPPDWGAYFGATSGRHKQVAGASRPELRNARALAGTERRNYDYDRFWVVFPSTYSDGSPLFSQGDGAAELIVRIHDKEARVSFRIPEAAR